MAKSRSGSKTHSKSSRKSSKTCPPGQILRKGYRKKAHLRRAYERDDGTEVHASYVDPAYVAPACVKDMGKPGKTPPSGRVLPKPGTELHLSRFGYKVDKSESKRREALLNATKETQNPLEVLRRLNLLRNYQADVENKRRMSRDVKYMSDVYDQWKKTHGLSRSVGSKRSRSSRSSRSSKRSSSSRSSKRSRSSRR